MILRNSFLALMASLALGGCVTSHVEDARETVTGLNAGESIVIMAKSYHLGNETERKYIRCIEDKLARGRDGLNVIPHDKFVDSLFPWFEPRTAPLKPDDIHKLLAQEPVAERMAELKTEYMIWIDGNTVRTDSAGSITCGIGPGGAGCFGFGTW